MNSLFEWNPGQHYGWWLSKLSASDSVQLVHLGWSWHWCSLLQSHRDRLQLPASPIFIKCRQHSQCCGLGFAHKLFFTHPAVVVGNDVVVAVLSPGGEMRSSKHSKRVLFLSILSFKVSYRFWVKGKTTLFGPYHSSLNPLRLEWG